MCRAVAAAVLGDCEKVKYVPLTAQALTALQSGEIDMLSRNTTFRPRPATSSLGLNDTVVTYYDTRFGAEEEQHAKRAKSIKNQTPCSPRPPPRRI